MAFLDVSSSFTYVPIDFVISSILSRWINMENYTVLPRDKFQEGIKFLIQQT